MTCLAVVSSLLAAFAFGCSDSSSSSSSSSGGGGTDAGDAGPIGCLTTGRLTVSVTGLSGGPQARVKVTGPSGTTELTESRELDLPAGDYTITADTVTWPDPLVRTAYRATVSTANVTLCGPPVTVTVAYEKIPSSNELWMSNANGAANVLGYPSAALAATSTQAATHSPKTKGGKGIAFDKDGNLWAIGATTVDPILVRYSAASLTEADPTPDRKIDIKNSGCSPYAHALAFDASGNLWVSALCEKKVVRVAAAQLGADGEVTPSVEVSGFQSPKGLAFDADGNLWVADTKAIRFNAASLAASTTVASAHATLSTVEDAADDLAFDATGNLWIVGGSQINLTQIAKADLAAAGARTPTAVSTISVGVGALPEGIAFDEGGGLWIATSAGKFARLGPSQLGTSSTYADPTVPERVITSNSVGSAGSMAIFPAPAGLPLYHRLP